MERAITMSVKISPENAKLVRLLAVLENRNIKDVFDEAISAYVTRQKESLEILARPDWMETIKQNENKFKKGETITHEELKRRLGLAG